MCCVPVLAGCAGTAGTGFVPLEGRNDPGYRLYVNKCAGCHRLYDPASYSDTEWRYWMDSMTEKAHLTPREKQTLMEYLERYRPRPSVPDRGDP